MTDLLKPIKDAIEDYVNAHCIDHNINLYYDATDGSVTIHDIENDNEIKF